MPYKSSKKSVDYKQNKAIKRLERQLQPETKALTTVFNSAIVSSTGTITHLSAVAQGDGGDQRDGLAVKADMLMMRATALPNPSMTNPSVFVRRIIFKDNQQVADTNPAVLDVLQTANYLSPPSLLTNGRVKILSDTMFKLTSITSANAGHIFVKNKKLNHIIRYNSTASSDIQKNGVYVLHISNITSGDTSNLPYVEFQSTLKYVDN